jgi:probable phosphoglycerate mutase
LIRHGRTATNAANRFVSREDPALDERGVEQARTLGRALAAEPIGPVYTSPMRRARETAEAVLRAIDRRDRAGDRIVVDERLMELGFGEFEGKTEDEIRREGDRELFRDWRQGIPPRYPRGAETFEAAGQRASELYRELVASREPAVVVVAHSHLLRILLAVAVLGVDAHHHRRLKLDSGRMALVEWEEDVPRLVGLNTTCVGSGD